MQRSFNVERVTTVEGWQTLAADWDRVLRETAGYTPLQTFGFLSTWWSVMAGGRRLWILVFRSGDSVVGIAPLQMLAEQRLGREYRVLQLIGMTEDILRPALLFPVRDAAALRTACIDYLAAVRDEWDVIEFDELAQHDPTCRMLAEVADRTGRLWDERRFHDCPYLDLDPAREGDYWSERSARLLKNLRNSMNRLQRLGQVNVEIYDSPDSVASGFDAFEQVAASSWKHDAKIGMAGNARYGEFYRALLLGHAATGNARVMTLNLDRRPIAATFGIDRDGIYCALQIVHDRRFDRYSAGTLLEQAEMRTLLESSRFVRYEFMGGALRNKLRWTSEVAETVCVVIAVADWRNRLLRLLEDRLKPWAKRILGRLGLFKPYPATRQAFIESRRER